MSKRDPDEQHKQICSTKQAKRFLINKLKILPIKQLMFCVVNFTIHDQHHYHVNVRMKFIVY
jgi:hypothetical protein